MSKPSVLICLSAVLAASCSPSLNNAPTAAVIAPIHAVTSASIQANLALATSAQESATGLTPTLGGAAASGVGASQSGSGLTPAGSGLTPSGAGSAGTGSGLTPGSSVAASTDATAVDYSARITVSAALTDGSTAACEVVAPFSAISCSPSSFDVSRAQIEQSGPGELIVRLSASNGVAGEYLDSNALAVHKFGIQQVSDTRNSNSVSDSPSALTVFGNRLLWVAKNQNGFTKLFSYDGTALTQVSDLRGDNAADDFAGPGIRTTAFASFDGKLHFIGRDASSSGIFSYDGTSLVKEASLGGQNAWMDFPSWNFKVIDSALYLADTAGTDAKIFKFDGTSYTQVSAVRSGANDLASGISPFLIGFNSSVLFSASPSGTGSRLYKFDGTAISTVSDVAGPVAAPIQFGASLYFIGTNASAKTKLFAYDGTSIAQISNTAGAAGADDIGRTGDYPDPMTQDAYPISVWGSKLYFAALNSSGVSKLYSYDGSTITQVSNTSGSATLDDLIGLVNGSYQAPVEFGGALYFSAATSRGISKLHKYDGSTIKRVSNTTLSATVGDAPVLGPSYGGKLYFTALSPKGKRKLFAYDGSDVIQVSNTAKDSEEDDSPANLTVFGDKLYFSAKNENGVEKLYSLCDLSAGCTP